MLELESQGPHTQDSEFKLRSGRNSSPPVIQFPSYGISSRENNPKFVLQTILVRKLLILWKKKLKSGYQNKALEDRNT
jgi:hypothetical protein